MSLSSNLRPKLTRVGNTLMQKLRDLSYAGAFSIGAFSGLGLSAYLCYDRSSFLKRSSPNTETLKTNLTRLWEYGVTADKELSSWAYFHGNRGVGKTVATDVFGLSRYLVGSPVTPDMVVYAPSAAPQKKSLRTDGDDYEPVHRDILPLEYIFPTRAYIVKRLPPRDPDSSDDGDIGIVSMEAARPDLWRVLTGTLIVAAAVGVTPSTAGLAYVACRKLGIIPDSVASVFFPAKELLLSVGQIVSRLGCASVAGLGVATIASRWIGTYLLEKAVEERARKDLQVSSGTSTFRHLVIADDAMDPTYRGPLLFDAIAKYYPWLPVRESVQSYIASIRVSPPRLLEKLANRPSTFLLKTTSQQCLPLHLMYKTPGDFTVLEEVPRGADICAAVPPREEIATVLSRELGLSVEEVTTRLDALPDVSARSFKAANKFLTMKDFDAVAAVHLRCHGPKVCFTGEPECADERPSPGDCAKVLRLRFPSEPSEEDVAIMEKYCLSRPARSMYAYVIALKAFRELNAKDRKFGFIEQVTELLNKKGLDPLALEANLISLTDFFREVEGHISANYTSSQLRRP